MRAIRREQVLALAGTVVLCLLAWRYLVVEAAGMSEMAAMTGVEGMERTGERPGPAELGYLFTMWSVMMVAMMLPSALPTILLFTKLQQGRRERSAAGEPGGRRPDGGGRVGGGGPGGGLPGAATLLFVGGYLIAWSAYSGVAAITQWALQAALLVSPAMVSVSSELSGGLLLLAGAYQLTPMKERCVRHCRSPLSFLTSHWREGAGGAVRMGIHHGAYCVGCCWALMALLFVLGVMNLFWVLALAALVLLEKAVPRQTWITPGVGLTLMAAGVWVLADPPLRLG